MTLHAPDHIVPGQVGMGTVHVHNGGDIVESYRLDVLGPAAAYTELVPAEVNLLPCLLYTSPSPRDS